MVGQTECGKVTFIQNVAQNKMFGDIKNVFRLTKITLSRKRETERAKYIILVL